MFHHFHQLHFHFENLLPFFDQWGYLIIGLSAFLEGLPIIGFFSPGATALILGGFIAKTGALDFEKILILAMISAFLGDFLSYLSGSFYGHHFLKKYGRFFFLKEEHILKTQNLLKNHPGKAIILGRFHFFTRALAPFLAGVSEIKILPFICFAAISSVLWSTIHVVAGYIVGQGFAVAAKFLNIAFFVGVILIVLIFYGYRFIESRRHIFEKYHLNALILNILSIYIFVKVLEDVVEREWLYRTDVVIQHFIPTIWHPTLIFIMTVITNLFSPANVVWLSLFFIGYLLSRKKYYYGLLSVLSILFGVLAEYVLKIIFGIARPIGGLLFTPDFSFPSGHATIVTIVGILIYHCLRKDLKSRIARNGLLVGVVAMILLVGFSRIYLNLHWFSDVLGGYALGVFSVTFFILLLRWGKFFGEELWRIGRAIIFPRDGSLT